MTDLSHPSQIRDASHARDARTTSMPRCASRRTSAATSTGCSASSSAASSGLYLHEVGPEQERFVETFGREVLPRLR